MFNFLLLPLYSLVISLKRSNIFKKNLYNLSKLTEKVATTMLETKQSVSFKFVSYLIETLLYYIR